MGNIACILIACITNVSNKLSEKTSHVIRIEQAFRDDLSVTGISQSFAVRVAAYYAFEIGMHRTVISLTDVIKKFVRAFKASCIPDIRIDGFHLYALAGDCNSFCRDYFYLFKRMPGKLRFPSFFLPAFQYIYIFLPIVQALITDETQFHRVSCPTFHGKFTPARNGFGQSEDIQRVVCLFKMGIYRSHHFRKWNRLCLQSTRRRTNRQSRFPGRIIITFPVPRTKFKTGIINFTCKYGIMQNRPRSRFP